MYAATPRNNCTTCSILRGVLISFSYPSSLKIIVAFDFRRECSGFHVTVVRVECSLNNFESLRIHSQELWFETGIKTEHILIDQNLTAHMWPCTYTNSWNRCRATCGRSGSG